MEIHIPQIQPDIIFNLNNLPITNTIINGWLAILIFLALGIAVRSTLTLRPRGLQNFLEAVLETFLGYGDLVTGDRAKTLRFLPLAGGIFFFILVSNWLSLLPGTGSLSWRGEFFLRPASTDLNLTVAMALVSVISSHIFGFLTVGFFAQLNKFVQIGAVVKSFKHGPIAIFTAVVSFFAGLIEIVSEAAKVLSLSLRLFGNIFAGEVLLSVMFSLFAFLLPAPFMFFELFVGLVQAIVFAILTLSYLSIATSEAHSH